MLIVKKHSGMCLNHFRIGKQKQRKCSQETAKNTLSPIALAFLQVKLITTQQSYSRW